jgi:chromosome segregation ATPase
MTSLESALAECDALRAELEEAKKQARLGWERAAEKDRAYGEALRERDEARAVDAGRTRFCEQCMAVARERDELQANVDFLIQSNRADILVLLEIHRKHVVELAAARDEARAESARLQERVATQDDGLRYGEKVCADLMAQIEGLRGKLDALATAHERDLVTIWHEATEAIHPPGSAREVAEEVRSLRQERNIAHEAIAEWRRRVEKTEDQANANARKIDKLVNERRQLRARLVECRPWVGVCPFPNHPGFSEMIAIRDLADDTLEEVKP